MKFGSVINNILVHNSVEQMINIGLIMIKYKLIILNSCPTKGRTEGWYAMKPLY